MRILIDGYNLLHASDVFPPASAPPTLEQSRRALLDFLVERLPAKQLSRTIVTFDAVGAPPGLPREMNHRGLLVLFAPRGGTGDELLEELILAEADPRNLLVVSSDHRVQRAARQRGGKFMDSESWWREITSGDPNHSTDRSFTEKPEMDVENPFPWGYAADERE
jgi:predicted RNA-binding protein with PIN domain